MLEQLDKEIINEVPIIMHETLGSRALNRTVIFGFSNQ